MPVASQTSDHLLTHSLCRPGAQHAQYRHDFSPRMNE
jgi:hypothetical protein